MQQVQHWFAAETLLSGMPCKFASTPRGLEKQRQGWLSKEKPDVVESGDIYNMLSGQ